MSYLQYLRTAWATIGENGPRGSRTMNREALKYPADNSDSVDDVGRRRDTEEGTDLTGALMAESSTSCL